MKNYSLRPATAADAVGMLNVYAYYVRNTAATFEYEPPDVAEFTTRIGKILPDFPWLVCECDGEIIGYAYAGKHRERTAYQWSPESTIYIASEHHGTGIARIMYETVFNILKHQGFVNVYASVLSTNLNSNHFHKAMGFEEIGMFRNVGYKLGEWHCNNWYQLHLTTHIPNPPPPKKMNDILHTAIYGHIMHAATEKMRMVNSR